MDKIKKEASYHELCNAGHITYVELDGDTTQNVEAFEKVIQFMKSSGIGSGAINHPIDHNPLCGYNGIIIAAWTGFRKKNSAHSHRDICFWTHRFLI